MSTDLRALKSAQCPTKPSPFLATERGTLGSTHKLSHCSADQSAIYVAVDSTEFATVIATHLSTIVNADFASVLPAVLATNTSTLGAAFRCTQQMAQRAAHIHSFVSAKQSTERYS